MLHRMFVIGLLAASSMASGQILYHSGKIQAADGERDDLFGRALALSPDGVMAAGAAGDDDEGSNAGAVYLFDMENGNQLHKLLPADGEGGSLGSSVAIRNGIVAAGANGDDSIFPNAGSVYLFDMATGTQVFKLVPADTAQSDAFGGVVTFGEGLLAVSAARVKDNGVDSGAVYIFDADTYTQLAKLTSDDIAPGDFFGSSVRIGDGVIAIGATGDDDNGERTGAVYLFDATTLLQLNKIVPADCVEEDRFGGPMLISDGVLTVGVPRKAGLANDDGAVYFFDIATGTQIHKLEAPFQGARERFGASVNEDGGRLIVGATHYDFTETDIGAAYLYDAATYSLFGLVVPEDGDRFDMFGGAMRVQGGVIAGGSAFDDDAGSHSGSIYLFDLNPCNPADLVFPPGTHTIDDIDAFVTAFLASDLAADCDQSGAINVDDVDCFVANYLAGCP